MLASWQGEGKELVSVCLHASRVRIARERGTGKSVRKREGGVEGVTEGKKRGGKRRGERTKRIIRGEFQGRAISEERAEV